MYGRYGSQDTFRYEYWNYSGSGGDRTEFDYWAALYDPRHYPYKNIASGEKPYDLESTYIGQDAFNTSTIKLWALEIVLEKFITSFVNYSYSGDNIFYGRYGNQDTIRYIVSHSSDVSWDYTEDKARWYEVRHEVHKNIPTDEKIYDFGYYYTGYYTDRLWAL